MSLLTAGVLMYGNIRMTSKNASQQNIYRHFRAKVLLAFVQQKHIRAMSNSVKLGHRGWIRLGRMYVAFGHFEYRQD